MNDTSTHSLVITDYPVKFLSYNKLLKRLHIESIDYMDWIPDPDDAIYPSVALVIVDMNLPSDEEMESLEIVKICFPNACIVFFEEDQCGAYLHHSDQRHIAQIGKLLELDKTEALIQSLIENGQPTTPQTTTISTATPTNAQSKITLKTPQ